MAPSVTLRRLGIASAETDSRALFARAVPIRSPRDMPLCRDATQPPIRRCDGVVSGPTLSRGAMGIVDKEVRSGERPKSERSVVVQCLKARAITSSNGVQSAPSPGVGCSAAAAERICERSWSASRAFLQSYMPGIWRRPGRIRGPRNYLPPTRAPGCLFECRTLVSRVRHGNHTACRSGFRP
jgi:hypothetical protein